MKLYVVKIIQPGGEFPTMVWYGTKEEARKRVKQEDDARFYEEEVPTNKPGLLEWLNEWMGEG